MGATAIPLASSDGTLSDIGAAGLQHYVGITVRETAGTPATLRIRQGGATGTILDTIYLAANDSIAAWFSPVAKTCRGDLYEEHITGTYEGSVFVM